MTIVAVVRPGWTDFDEQHRILGSLGLPLNQRGVEQIPGLIARLTELGTGWQSVFSGTLQPAKRTAELIADAFGIPLRECEDLNNLNQGLWQGSSIEEIRRKTPRIFKQWEDAPETICPSEGEPWEMAVERIRYTLKKPLRKLDRFVIVASEPLATLVSCVLTGEPPDLSAAFPTEPRDPVIEILESAGRESEFHRKAALTEPKRTLDSPTPAPVNRRIEIGE